MIYLDKQINRETLAPNMDPVEKAERYLQSVQLPIVITKYFFQRKFRFIFVFKFRHQ
jgi:hypothetical protein